MKKFKFSHYYKQRFVFNYKNYQVHCYGLLENNFDNEMSYKDLLFIFDQVDVYKNGDFKKTIYTQMNVEF